MIDREITLYERAVEAGDAGLVGMDGSGNDWEFPQQLGSTAVENTLFNNESSQES